MGVTGVRAGLLRWPLAGREEELEAFAAAWAGQGLQALVVFGPAGVGKSRLAEECLSRAAKGSWKAARVRATAAAAAVPLGALAHLIPAGVDLSDPVKGFGAVTRALAGSGRKRRWVLLVDDLHLLDAASTVLLRQLLDTGVLRLIGTVRSGEPVSDAVDALTGGDRTHRIDLTTFSEGQLEQVVRAALGGPVGHRTLQAFYTASGGNALYLRELVHGALTDKALASDGEIWELTQGALPSTPQLTELISRRLAAAGSDARGVLELLALCESLPLADAQSVSSLEVLAALEAADLVHVVKDQRRATVVLSHPLYGEILRSGIPTLHRRRLLLEQADRLKPTGARRREDTLRLASWQLAATGTADPAVLVQAAALARHGHDYAQVLSLLNALPKQLHTGTTRLLLAEAYFEQGQVEQADAVLAEAEQRADGEADLLIATVTRTFNLCWIGDRTAEALTVNDAARTKVTTAAGNRILQVNEASMLTFSGHPDRGLAVLEGLEDTLEQAQDVNAWLRGVKMKAAGLAMQGHTDQALKITETAYAVHKHVAASPDAIVPHPDSQLVCRVLALTEAGRLVEARRTGRQAFAHLLNSEVETTGLFNPSPPMFTMWAAYFLARAEWLAGHPATARRWYAEAAALARAHHHVKPMRLVLSGITACAAVLGDHASAQTTQSEIHQYTTDRPFPGEDRLGEAWLLASQGRQPQARTVLTEAAQTACDTGHLSSEALLLTDLARLGSAPEVTGRLTELAEHCDGAFAPARAHLATALAAHDPEQVQAVTQELHAIGADLLAAEAATASAAAWQQAGQTRRATAATNQAQTHLAHCQGAHTPLLAADKLTAVLTEREKEVALLAASGTPSKDIAATLHLSVRTVDNHLQHAYTKLGVTTRRELAATLDTKIQKNEPLAASRL
ncbi:LuxR C-terminal-related transcriptional regulator [Streptomyces sp. NPDC002285]